MTELVRLVLDVLAFLWPFRIVRVYQRGVYYVLGRVWREAGPGLWVVVPFFTEVATYHVNDQPLTLPQQRLTLRDGRQLVVRVLVVIKVVDVVRADTAVADFLESCQEQAQAVVADRLMAMEGERIDEASRRQLLAAIRQSLAPQLAEYGCAVERLSFVQFVLNPRTISLLGAGADAFDA